MATLGFALIIFGVVFSVVSRDAGTARLLIPVVSGAVVDAVAALFFSVNVRAQRVMVEFFDKLREDQRLSEALVVVQSMSDRQLAARVEVLRAVQLVGLPDVPDLFKQAVAGHALTVEQSGPNEQ